MSKTALITGITGQDGSYLADLLVSKGYKVFGLVRRLSRPNTENIRNILEQIELIEGDLTDQASLNSAMKKASPDEVYNLAAQSFVGTSWTQPELTANVTGLGALRVFEAVRQVCPSAKIYQASSSEMFGNVTGPQSEKSPMHPRSPYGVAKLFAHSMAKVYRESYDMFIACGILFNHESPRRGIEFVSRKITRAVAMIKSGKQKELVLGDTSARRDWGFAPEYVEGMWKMLQLKHPDDYVVATGEAHSVYEFVQLAFEAADISNWREKISTSELHKRPAELYHLIGDYSRAREFIDWEPKIKFDKLVNIMVEADLKSIQ